MRPTSLPRDRDAVLIWGSGHYVPGLDSVLRSREGTGAIRLNGSPQAAVPGIAASTVRPGQDVSAACCAPRRSPDAPPAEAPGLPNSEETPGAAARRPAWPLS